MPKSILPGIVCFLILTLLLSIHPASADTARVESSDTPADGVADLTYETVWEQPAEADEFLIGFMIDAAYDRSGNICIVNFQQKNMVILDPEGNWLQTIGREGEGPGELQDARKVLFDGNRYGLLQAIPGTIVWFESDGTPSDKIRIGEEDNPHFTVGTAMQKGVNIYAWIMEFRQTDSGYENESWVSRIETSGTTGPVLFTPPDKPDASADDTIDEGKAYRIWQRRWAGDSNGGIWVAPERDRYVLQYWNSSGELEREVTRKYEPIERNKHGRQHVITQYENRGVSTDRLHVGKTEPVVRGIRMGDDGSLWVELDRGGNYPDSDIIVVYDIFTPDGQHIKHIRMHSGLDVDSRRVLDDTSALVLATDTDGESILCLLKTAAGATEVQ
jgi:hypothetical protein